MSWHEVRGQVVMETSNLVRALPIFFVRPVIILEPFRGPVSTVRPCLCLRSRGPPLGIAREHAKPKINQVSN